MGEAPDSIVLVESAADVDALPFPDARPARLRDADDALGRRDRRDDRRAARAASRRSTRRRRKTSVTRPPTGSGRSRRCSREIDLLLVVGSRNSSNSNRLVEVARAGGVASYLIDDETEIDEAWLDGVAIVGVTSGASAPERLVDGVCDWFRDRGVTDIEPYSLADEDVEFRLPVELRRELALAESQG